MKAIGGNILGELQVFTAIINEIGESIKSWAPVLTLCGFLDLSSGEYKRTIFNSKIEESTHVFICDYVSLNINVGNARMLINNQIYDVTSIDNPMNLNYHLEIFLKYVGGQN